MLADAVHLVAVTEYDVSFQPSQCMLTRYSAVAHSVSEIEVTGVNVEYMVRVTFSFLSIRFKLSVNMKTEVPYILESGDKEVQILSVVNLVNKLRKISQKS